MCCVCIEGSVLWTCCEIWVVYVMRKVCWDKSCVWTEECILFTPRKVCCVWREKCVITHILLSLSIFTSLSTPLIIRLSTPYPIYLILSSLPIRQVPPHSSPRTGSCTGRGLGEDATRWWCSSPLRRSPSRCMAPQALLARAFVEIWSYLRPIYRYFREIVSWVRIYI